MPPNVLFKWMSHPFAWMCGVLGKKSGEKQSDFKVRKYPHNNTTAAVWYVGQFGMRHSPCASFPQ